MQLYARRYSLTDVAVGSDNALVGWPIPKNSSLNYCRGEVHSIGAAPSNIGNVLIYGLEGWLMPVSDSQVDLDSIGTMWDTLVPKDDDLVDIDTDFAADTDPVKEIGEVSVSQLFGQERVANLQRIYQKEGFITYANATSALLPGTPPANTFIPISIDNINVSKKYFMPTDGALIFGYASPTGDFTADDNVIAANRLDGMFVLRFLADYMDDAQINLASFTEAGAESPYEDVMSLILNFLEKVSVEDSAFSMGGTVWTVATKIIAGIRVEGTRRHQSIGPDSQAT